MERKELSNNRRELSRGSISEPGSNNIPELNSAATTGVLSIPDHWEGYECLLSDDLFTVLALDVWRYEEYDDELVNQHYEEISRFLNNLIRLRDSGIAFHDRYPKLNIELAKRRVKEAFTRLETFRKRREYYKEVLEEKKRSGRERLEMVITTIIADDKVTLEESLEFIELSTTLYFTEAEAAGILLESIMDRGFKPCKPFKPEKSQLYKLLSTEFERSSQIHQNSQIPDDNRFSSMRLSTEDLLVSGLIEEYLEKGGTTKGEKWLEFYKSLKEDFQIGGIADLNKLIETVISKKPLTLGHSRDESTHKSRLVDLVLVEGGTFLMGSDDNDKEQPIHSVTVNSFYIAKTVVNQELWEILMGSNPSKFKGRNKPVELVTWYDAVFFCNLLSEKEGLQRAYSGSGESIRCDFKSNGYRLPTEAEWEFAARGGNRSRGYTYSGSNSIDDVAWYLSNSKNETHDIGKKLPNELGIHDMSGNIWEWCWDKDGSYNSATQTNPRGSNYGRNRISRGGSWFYDAKCCRVTHRYGLDSDLSSSDLGFRLVRTR